MATQVDPLADLKAELAAEVKSAPDEEKTEIVEEKVEAKEDEPEEKVEPDDKPKAKKGYVPVARLNETEAKRRVAERERDELRAKVTEYESKTGKVPTTEDERKSIAQEARAQARIEVLAENFVASGYESYGKEEFDSVSHTLSDLGAPNNLVLIALEATGSPTAAAKAIFNLGQEEAPEIEKIFKMSPLRLAAQLASYSKTRRAAKDEDDGKVNGKTVSKANAPIKPIGSSAKIVDDELSDDLSEEQFTERFNKVMDKRAARH